MRKLILPGYRLEHCFCDIAEQGLVNGKRIGIDASTMEANAALRTIVRRDDGRTYREMLEQMARESGIETPSADDLVRIDRTRKGKKLSNEEWTSTTDPEAKIAKLRDGRTLCTRFQWFTDTFNFLPTRHPAKFLGQF